MTDRVLTDSEVTAEWKKFLSFATEWHPCLGTPHDFARAVEAAVLAKCVKFTDGSYAIFRDGCEAKITEREARKRERDAYRTGQRDGEGSAMLDKRYPVPTCDKCGREVE